MYKYSFSLSILVISLVSLSLLLLSVPNIWPAFQPILFDYGRMITVTIVFLMAVHFVAVVLIHMFRSRNQEKSDGLGWYITFFKNYPVVDLVAAMMGMIITITSFTVFKGAVIGADGYDWDATFIAWDKAIFGGYHAWEWTHSIFSTPEATHWIDFFYHPAFFPMMLGFLYCAVAHEKKALRHTYMISYLGSFLIIGMIMANMFDSAGPVFDGVMYGDGSTFAPLLERHATQLSAEAGPEVTMRLINYLTTLNLSDEIQMGAGISAMPSMHIVLVLLWLFPAWHLNKYLGVVFTIYTVIIWIGSVHLGWHYFVDGLVSLVVLSVIWRVAGHITGLYGRREPAFQVTRATT